MKVPNAYRSNYIDPWDELPAEDPALTEDIEFLYERAVIEAFLEAQKEKEKW